VLFVCINNQYGMSMHVRKSMNIEDISVRAASYGMPGRSVDGNDAVAVYTATQEARTAVRESGPLLLVLNTYRIMGHSKSDAGLYRPKEEVDIWKRKDPLRQMAGVLWENGVSAEQIEAMDAAAARTVEEAVDFAEASPEPSVDSVEEDLYS
jgi:pyruvate dehydrogenase E1 component alpha subunit